METKKFDRDVLGIQLAQNFAQNSTRQGHIRMVCQLSKGSDLADGCRWKAFPLMFEEHLSPGTAGRDLLEALLVSTLVTSGGLEKGMWVVKTRTFN